MKRIVDLQAHILPAFEAGVGPQTMAEAVNRVKQLVEAGVTDIFCTPAVNMLNMNGLMSRMEQNVNALQLVLDEQALGVTLHTGALVQLGDDMVAYILEHKDMFTLGDSHFMLVTAPSHTKVHHVESWLMALVKAGITPIVSEVESQELFFNEPERLLKWVDEGILLSCHIASFQPQASHYKRGLDLYKNGLIHFLGSGYHTYDGEWKHYFEAIARLDSELKQDVLGNVQLNERDLLADRNFYPTVPTEWRGSRPNFWTRLFSFAL